MGAERSAYRANSRTPARSRAAKMPPSARPVPMRRCRRLPLPDPPRVLARQRRHLHVLAAARPGKSTRAASSFAAERADTETLNARAASAELDVVAVSIARWPAIARDYLLLPHGMSVGRGYGPVVVATAAPRPRVARRARASASRACARPRTSSCACSCRASSRSSFPSAPYARAFEARAVGRRRRRAAHPRGAAHLSNARASRRSATSAKAGRRRRAGCRCRSAATRSAAASGPELVAQVSRLLPDVDRVGARAPRRDDARAPRGRDARRRAPRPRISSIATSRCTPTPTPAMRPTTCAVHWRSSIPVRTRRACSTRCRS